MHCTHIYQTLAYVEWGYKGNRTRTLCIRRDEPFLNRLSPTPLKPIPHLLGAVLITCAPLSPLQSLGPPVPCAELGHHRHHPAVPLRLAGHARIARHPQGKPLSAGDLTGTVVKAVSCLGDYM